MIKPLDHTERAVADQIHGIFQRSYREEARLLGAKSFPPLNRTADEIHASAGTFLGSWVGSDLAAVIEYTLSGSSLSIDSLVVEPGFFRRGLGRQLLEFLLDGVRWQAAEVETATGNEPAISLYRGLGFKESRVWKTPEGIEKIRLTVTSES